MTENITKEYCQQEFKKALYNIFGEENIAVAFIHGSFAKNEWTPPQDGRLGSDIDMFVCVEDVTLEQRKALEAWYVEFHEKHHLKADKEFWVELMTRQKLEDAIDKLDHLQVKMLNNARGDWDALSWGHYLTAPTLEKLGNQKLIEKLVSHAERFNHVFVKQLLDHFDKMECHEVFHRLGKYIAPWAAKLVDYLGTDPEVGLYYDRDSRSFRTKREVSSDLLLTKLQSFLEKNPIQTITDRKTLRTFKATYVEDYANGIDIVALSKLLADPQSLVSTTNHESRRALADFPDKWKHQLLSQLADENQHEQRIFGVTFGSLINWWGSFHEPEFQLPSEAVLAASRYPLINNTYIERSNDWMVRQTAYHMLWKELKQKTDFFANPPLRVAEHGCGTGDSSAFIAQGLMNYCNDDLRYYAGDTKRMHAEWASQRLNAVGAKAKVVWEDVYTATGEEIAHRLGLSAGEKVDITICEHSLYFALGDQGVLRNTLNNVISLEKKNGVFVAVITDQSDLDRIRERAPDNANHTASREPCNEIKEQLASLGLEVYSIELNSFLNFPDITEEQWESIASGAVTISRPSPDVGVNQTVHLLEFCCRPLEYMHRDGSLREYVNRVKEIIHFSDTDHPERNRLNTRSVMQLCASPGSTSEFQKALSQSVEAVNQGLASDTPSTVLSNVKGEQLMRVLPRLGCQR